GILNNNPATMMTDENIAHKVYFEPLTVKTIENILEKEQPDSILLSVSGQTGLNLAFALDEQNILEKYKVQVLGTPIDAIKQGEDRDRKSTRLNSSHVSISYAVFCLKKKKYKKEKTT